MSPTTAPHIADASAPLGVPPSLLLLCLSAVRALRAPGRVLASRVDTAPISTCVGPCTRYPSALKRRRTCWTPRRPIRQQPARCGLPSRGLVQGTRTGPARSSVPALETDLASTSPSAPTISADNLVPLASGAVTTGAYLYHLMAVVHPVLDVAPAVWNDGRALEDLFDRLFFHVARHPAYREKHRGGPWTDRFREIAHLVAPAFALRDARVGRTIRNIVSWVNHPTNADKVGYFAWRSGSHARWVRYFARLELVGAANPVLHDRGLSLLTQAELLHIPRSTFSRLLKQARPNAPRRGRWTSKHRRRLVRRMKNPGDCSEMAVCRALAPSLGRTPEAVHRYWMRLKKRGEHL